MTKNRERFLLGSVALSTCATALLSAGSMAAAQEEPAVDEARRLNQVLVTATRRDDATLQDVPVAVTALGPELLADTGFEALGDLEQLAPSIGITQTESAASGTNISIRGIGTGSNNPGFEPAVGIFIDGVYRTRTGIALADTPPLAGVEVLRGPQGTLFGRNTSAGVVNILTEKPGFEGRRSLTLGVTDFNGAYVAGFTEGAISENWAARIDGRYRVRDGYITDVNTDRDVNDIDRAFLRGQLFFDGDNSDLRLIADYAEADEQCCVGVNLGTGGTAAAINGAAALNGLIGITGEPAENYRVALSPNRNYGEDIAEWGLSAEYNRTLANYNLTSITSYRNWEAVRDQDIDFSGIDRAHRNGTFVGDKTFTQELRLQGDWNNVDWLVGAFFISQETTYDDRIQFGTDADLYTDLLAQGGSVVVDANGNVLFGGGQLFGTLDSSGSVVPSLIGVFDANTGATLPGGTPANPGAGLFPIFIPRTPEGAGQQADKYTVDTTAFSLFTHNEIALTDALTATVGLRYNFEEKKLDADLTAVVPGCDFLLANPSAIGSLGTLAGLVCNPAVNTAGNGLYSDDRTENELTGTVKLAYTATDNMTVYGSYSRGFKSGGYNLDRAAFSNLLLGAAPDINDLEFEGETVDAYELGAKTEWYDGLLTVNAALFFSDVTDFQENIFTGINFRTINTDVESYGLELDVAASPIDGLILQGGFIYNIAERKNDFFVPTGTGGQLQVASAGVQLSNTPEIAITGSGTYTFPITGSIEGLVHGNFRYNDDVFTVADPSIRDLTANDAYILVGARVGIMDADGVWELAIFGENITDEYYNLSSFTVPEQDNPAVYPGFPQMFGIEGKVNF